MKTDKQQGEMEKFPERSQQQPAPMDSSLHHEYLTIMDAKEQPKSSSDIVQLLLHHRIVFEPNSEIKSFNFTTSKVLPNSEVVEIFAELGQFSMKFLLLNQSYSSELFKGIASKITFDSTFSSVRIEEFEGQLLTLKVIRLSQISPKTLKAAIKELCILRILSALGLTVRVQDCLGFDLVMYSDGVMFAMEAGTPVPALDSKCQERLRQDLALMHSLHLVHCDIKPENVLFSPSLGRPVLIDFGLSEALREEPGQRTLVTGFRGNTSHCSDEMFSLFMKGSAEKPIDLYHNDAVGIKSTLKALSNNSELSLNSHYKQQASLLEELEDQPPTVRFIDFEENQSKIDSQTCLHLVRMKHTILQQQVSVFTSYLNKYSQKLNPAMLGSVLKFIKEMIPFSASSLQIHAELKRFSHYQQYQQIMDRINYTSYRLGLQVHQHKAQNNYELRFLEQEEEGDANNQLEVMVQFVSNFDHYTVSKERYVSVLLRLIRFDIKSIPFSQKVKVLRSFHRKSEIIPTSERTGDLSLFQDLIVWLLRQINKGSFSDKWAKDHVFLLIELGVFVDADFYSQWEQFHKNRLLSLFTSDSDKQYVIFSSFIISNIINFRLKIRPQHIDGLNKLVRQLLIFRRQAEQTWRGLTSYPRLDKLITTSLKQHQHIYQGYEPMNHHYQVTRCMVDELTPLKTNKYRQKGDQIYYMFAIQSLLKYHSKQQAILFHQQFMSCYLTKEQPQFFFWFICQSLVTNSLGQVAYQIQYLIRQVKQVIGSKCLLQDLTFDIYLCPLSIDEKQVQDKLSHLVNTCRLTQSAYYPIQKMIALINSTYKQDRVKATKQIQPILIQFIMDIESIRKTPSAIRCVNVPMTIHFAISFLQLKICLATISRDLWIRMEQLIEEDMENCSHFRESEKESEPLVGKAQQLIQELHKTYLHLVRGQTQQVLTSYKSLHGMSSAYQDFKFLSHNFRMNILWYSFSSEDTQTIDDILSTIYEESCSDKGFLIYFTDYSSPLIYMTLSRWISKHRSHSVIYGFILWLSRQLSKLPLLSYFHKFRQQVYKICKQHLEWAQSLFSFPRIIDHIGPIQWENRFDTFFLLIGLLLSQQQTAKNAILVKIARGLTLLPIFARNSFLCPYYFETLRKKMPRRQKIFQTLKSAKNHVPAVLVKRVLTRLLKRMLKNVSWRSQKALALIKKSKKMIKTVGQH